MLKKIIRQKFVSIERQSTELDNLAFVAMVTNFYHGNKEKYRFSFAHSIDVPYLVFAVLKVFEFGLQLCYENVAIIP